MTPPYQPKARPLPTLDSPATGQDAQLSRSLSTGGNVLITLSGISPASSVFILGGAALTISGTGVFLGFTIAGILSILIAFCYAELASRYPIAGGDYSLISRVLGPGAGTAVFFISLLTLPLITAIFALGVADYLGVTIAGLDPLATALVVVTLATLTACFNIRANAWVTGVFLFLEMAALGLLAFLGFINVEHPITDLLVPQSLGEEGALSPLGMTGLVLAITQGIFAYNGYGSAVYFAEETKNAKQSVARAVLWSAVITILAEVVALSAVLLGTSSIEDLLGSDLPVEAFLSARAGTLVSTIVLVGVALAIINAIIAILLQSGRLLFAAARDGALPRAASQPLSRVSAKTHTPVNATIVTGLIALLACLVPFELLVNATGSTVAFIYGFIAIAALVVRRKPAEQDGYRMPLWPAPPVIALVTIATIFVLTLQDPGQWISVGISLAIVAFGGLYYAVYLRRRSGMGYLIAEDEANEG